MKVWSVLQAVIILLILMSLIYLQWSCKRQMNYDLFYRDKVSSQVDSGVLELSKRISALEDLVITNEALRAEYSESLSR